MSEKIRTFCCGSSRINGRVKASRPLGACLIVEVDSADNKVIHLRPVKALPEVSHA